MSRSVTSRRRFAAALLLAMFAAGTLAWGAEPPARPRLGALYDNYPFSFRGADGELQGFACDLVHEVEQVMGLQFERVVGSTSEINPAFRAGRLDVLQSYAQFPERESEAEFSFPYLTLNGAIFVREGEQGIRSMADLRGRKVLVHPGSMGETVLRRAGLAESIVFVDSVELALAKVARGEGDATLATRLTGLAIAHQKKLKGLRPLAVPVPGYEVRYCMAVRRGDRELLARINEGLAVLVRTQRFDALYRKWFGHVEPTGYTQQQIVLAVAVGLGVALAVALWAVRRQAVLRARLARQAEALRRSEENYRGIFEGSHYGLLVLERRADGDLGVQQANPAVRRLIGCAAPSPGTPLAAFLADEALGARIAAAVKSAAPGEASEFELECGRRAWRVMVSAVGGRWLVALTEISEQVAARRKLQEQEAHLQRTQRLEAIGTLAGGIAHDFNNVLTAIFGNIELGLTSVPAEHPAAAHQQQVLRAARRARDLVRQILTFSRQTESSRRPMDVTPVVEETLAFLRSATGGAVELRHERTGTLPRIIGDPVQVHQVLMNLGTNAVQAMRGTQGCLVFREETVRIGDAAGGSEADPAAPRIPGLAGGDYVHLIVSDTGPGMTSAVLERIFEPFFTTKAPGEGTGLGLSVVHGVMQQHRGAVTVESEPGRGTRFHLYFPVAAVEVAPEEAESTAPVPRGRDELILLVDDETVIVEAARLILAKLGYRVSAHARAGQALAELAARPGEFAVVLTDLTMTEMSGLQLAARVRALRPELPVVLMSGYFSDGEKQEAQALGVGRLLPKPFTMESLARALAAVLPRRGTD
jgi:signal transduction histidine kinase/ActR/RegA family two-component response regulator